MKTKFSRLAYIVSMIVFSHISCCLCYGQDSLRLYPGITPAQHELAQQAMYEFFDQHWDSAEACCRKMLALEQQNDLLPMSYMLRFAMRAWRILNDECKNQGERNSLFYELDPLRDKCLRILHKHLFPDSTRSTRLFLEGGINGFNATLKIRSHPFIAMFNGLSSVRMLDSARALTPYNYDAFLGLGIAQCALANEPGIIRAAMTLFRGLHVNLDTGLSYLRICSQKGFYTNDGAREYLIQFLSPFKPSEAAEKQQIFKFFLGFYPGNPYYVFQKIDEGMAFHRREVFTDKTIEWARPLIKSFDTCNYSHKRYVNLVLWQCSVIDSSLANELNPSRPDLRDAYSFYPVFLNAARDRFLLESDSTMPHKKHRGEMQDFQNMKDKAVSMLHLSNIDPMLREYYLYHIGDGMP